MDLLALLTSLQAQFQVLQNQLNDVQGAVANAVAPLNTEIADLKAQIAALTGGSGGGFSQADIDAAVANAVAPLNVQIADKNSQIAALQAQVDGIPAQVAAAVADFKAQVKAKFDADASDIDAFLS